MRIIEAIPTPSRSKYVSESCTNEFNGVAAITRSDVKHRVSSVTSSESNYMSTQNQFHKFTEKRNKILSGSGSKQHDNLWIVMDHETLFSTAEQRSARKKRVVGGGSQLRETL